MKRLNNLFEEICSLENLQVADYRASKGKHRQRGVRQHQINAQENLLKLNRMLVDKTYRTSQYTTFKIYEPKERIIFRLPYYPDRIVHHAVMNKLEPIFMRFFTADTYSCIKRKGIHAAQRGLRRALCDEAGTQYCLKLDIKKFYPSVDHHILKALLRRKFKDRNLLELLDGIIDSADGLPIGNYLSQYLANFYLTCFDHWIKEVKGVRYYFRYADDIVILASDKASLHALLAGIKEYLQVELKLTVKQTYQVFPVDARGIDFVGYVSFHTHTRLRKTIKKNFARKASRGMSPLTRASYYGWTKHCNAKHLFKTLTTNERVQKHGHCANADKLRRRENQNRQSSESGYNNPRLQSGAVKLPRPGRRQTSGPFNNKRRRKAHYFHQLPLFKESNNDGSEGRLPFQSQDYECQ
jgi:RNA-directed DNA polymerase